MLLIATASCAPPPKKHEGVIWAEAPVFNAKDYPEAALRDAISGRAEIQCTVANAPEPRNCTVQAETPANHGFGQSALNIVERGRFDPASIRPEDIGTTIVVTVPFSVDR